MIGVRYALFALLSIVLNLLVQFLTFHMYTGPHSIYVAMANGTIAGLLCKYLLDKHFIFYDQFVSLGDDARKFTLYSIIGALLTLLFWVFELSFDALFDLTNRVEVFIQLRLILSAKTLPDGLGMIEHEVQHAA